LHVKLDAVDLSPTQASSLAGSIAHVLNAQRELPLHTFHVSSGNITSSNVALTVHLESTPNPRISLRSGEPVLDVTLGVQPPINIGEVGPFIAQEIARLFADEGAALAYLIKDTPFARTAPPLSLTSQEQQTLDRRTTRAFKYAPNYHVTFSLFTPTASPSAWQIEEALQEYITPLLHAVSSINKVTIDTQVQLYASFSPSIAGPIFDEAKQHWTLKYGDLTGFVNAAEWPLNPSIGSGPTINFVLYVPSPDQSPLLINENQGTSWIIPQWGGVQIHNPTSKQVDRLTVEDLRPNMAVFADQLAALLSIPPSPPSLSLQISSLTRERATSLILSASSTLGALSRLTLKLKSIAIPDSVAKSVDETLRRLELACGDLREGRYQSALVNARVAEVEVEQAFFEPSMVGQVYFPEEHKVAVYVPLLGPMAVPLIMSGLKELRRLRGRKLKTT
jgi:phosphatidylinositol glycan class S